MINKITTKPITTGITITFVLVSPIPPIAFVVVVGFCVCIKLLVVSSSVPKLFVDIDSVVISSVVISSVVIPVVAISVVAIPVVDVSTVVGCCDDVTVVVSAGAGVVGSNPGQ